MLVLSRKEGQTIKIDDSIEVTVLSIQGNKVRLGIKAPAEVSIQRQEIVIKLDALKQMLDLQPAHI